MSLRRFCRHALLLSAVAFQPAYALINLNQGKDLIFVNSTYSFGYDSNVFTRAVAQSSVTHNVSLATDYTRQAGIISVAANAAVAAGLFQDLPEQNFIDPRFELTLRKRNVNLALDLQQADQRLRAQVAYRSERTDN